MNEEFLFVYGTLRKALVSPMDKLLVRHCDFISTASFQGTLYDVAGYPGVTESNTPASCVYGDLYRLHHARQLWPLLDHYEHCSNAFTKPYQYERKKRLIRLNNSDCVQAWIYLFNWNTDGLQKIASGDYLDFLDSNG